MYINSRPIRDKAEVHAILYLITADPSLNNNMFCVLLEKTVQSHFGRKLNIDISDTSAMDTQLKQLVEAKSGTITKAPYIRSGVRFVGIMCANGHEWFPRVSNILYCHSWCAHCAKNKKLTIEVMQQHAADRGGKCLTAVYQNSATPMDWECSQGHTWTATPNNVRCHGSWCPHCSVNIGEELVRATFEEAFPGNKFDRTRRVPCLMGLELDGYNEGMKLAFEYQGIQHYERVEYFHRNEGDFEAQQERDALTAERCADGGITLLVVSHEVGFTRLRAWVRGELQKLGFTVAPSTDTEQAFFDRVRSRDSQKEEKYQRVLKIIKEKGGVCLSDKYVGYRVPLRIRCSKGHEFMATHEAIDQPKHRGPRFCPECGGTRRRSFEELAVMVARCGYELLDEDRRGKDNNRYITVRCPKNHDEYAVDVNNFTPHRRNPTIPRKGCPECAKERSGDANRGSPAVWLRTHNMQLLDAYQNSTKNVRWMCSAGHITLTSFKTMKEKASKGNPCIDCDLEVFAEDNDLGLLTIRGPNDGSTTPLTWKCARCDTEFEMTIAARGRKISAGKTKFCQNKYCD